MFVLDFHRDLNGPGFIAFFPDQIFALKTFDDLRDPAFTDTYKPGKFGKARAVSILTLKVDKMAEHLLLAFFVGFIFISVHGHSPSCKN